MPGSAIHVVMAGSREKVIGEIETGAQGSGVGRFELRLYLSKAGGRRDYVIIISPFFME